MSPPGHRCLAGEPPSIGRAWRVDGSWRSKVAEVKLKAVKRADTGKGPARRSRAAGKVPGVVYGHGMEPVAIEVDRREFVTALHTDAGMNVLLDLDIDGDATLALTKELQRDPVRGALLHADFIKIDRTQEVEVEVPVHLVGTAAGAEEGGVLEHQLSSVLVRCRAIEVPQFVEADISRLQIGEALRVADLSEGRDFHILNDPETYVASVSAPVSEAELEAMEADAGVVQEESDEAIVEAAEAAAEAEATGAEGDASDAAGEGDES
jgi:large subunit ribosomal protein L25